MIFQIKYPPLGLRVQWQF